MQDISNKKRLQITTAMPVSINVNEKILYIIIFFLPYTTIKIFGLKISEIFSVFLAIFSFLKRKKRINIKSDTLIFTSLLSICIIISGLLSYVDPLNRMIVGNDEGIFYSFDFGWILKIFRLFIVYTFFESIKEIFSNKEKQKSILTIYIFSNFAIDLIIILRAISIKAYRFGIDRSRAMAIEPSEAGFINCFAILLQIFLLIRSKNTKEKILDIIFLSVMIIGQIFIGNTASFICTFISIFVSLFDYMRKTSRFEIKRLMRYMILCLTVAISVYGIFSHTSIFNKIKNYKYLMNIRGSSIAERIVAIQVCLKMFMRRPIFGIGFGNFGWYIDYFITSELYRYSPGGSFQPNILYAQLLAELGIFGFSIYIIFMTKNIRRIENCWKNRYLDSHEISMILGLLIYLLIQNFALTTLYSFQSWITFAIIENISYERRSV